MNKLPEDVKKSLCQIASLFNGEEDKNLKYAKSLVEEFPSFNHWAEWFFNSEDMRMKYMNAYMLVAFILKANENMNYDREGFRKLVRIYQATDALSFIKTMAGIHYFLETEGKSLSGHVLDDFVHAEDKKSVDEVESVVANKPIPVASNVGLSHDTKDSSEDKNNVADTIGNEVNGLGLLGVRSFDVMDSSTSGAKSEMNDGCPCRPLKRAANKKSESLPREYMHCFSVESTYEVFQWCGGVFIGYDD